MQSRPIKFRAWDKEGKRMVRGNCGLFMFVGTGTLGWQFADTWDFPVDEQFELMQYTGLKDKNGKGIYEGDIVKASYRNTPQVVEWIAKYAGFSIGGAMPERPVNSDFTDWEIIGNIYENPELLN